MSLEVTSVHDGEMVELIQARALVPIGARTRTARFDGADFGAGASFFYVDNDPGQGPGLHWHPYSETWIVIDGRVLFHVDGEELEATNDAIASVPPETPHKFTNIGEGRLRMLCIHASPRIIQYELPE
jgi:mannose-6-phosphate isomerase-like protein (cupin superfamily)